MLYLILRLRFPVSKTSPTSNTSFDLLLLSSVACSSTVKYLQTDAKHREVSWVKPMRFTLGHNTSSLARKRKSYTPTMTLSKCAHGDMDGCNNDITQCNEWTGLKSYKDTKFFTHNGVEPMQKNSKKNLTFTFIR